MASIPPVENVHPGDAETSDMREHKLIIVQYKGQSSKISFLIKGEF